MCTLDHVTCTLDHVYLGSCDVYLGSCEAYLGSCVPWIMSLGIIALTDSTELIRTGIAGKKKGKGTSRK